MLTGLIRRAEWREETGFMAEPRPSNGTLTWAPRALAVISCALALLAAQPAAGAVPAVKSRTLILEGTGVLAGGECVIRETNRPARAPAPAVAARRAEALLGGVRHWQILATMEILHRVLAGGLTAAERQVMPVMWFGQVWLGTADLPLTQERGEAGRGAEVIPIVERAFAIGHCLLAPPLS
jgi:hypothetical protein